MTETEKKPTTLILLAPDGSSTTKPEVGFLPEDPSPVTVWQFLEESGGLQRADIRTWHLVMRGRFVIVELEP